jgi:fermentation-respiration switch protein FrsA (DUF1100 family)
MKYLVSNSCTNDIKSNPKGYRSPSEKDMPYKEVTISTKDGLKLYGWFMYQQNTHRGSIASNNISINNNEEEGSVSNLPATFIYFHENAGNIGLRLPFCKFLYKNLKVNILVVGYRGYGYSEGTPSEQGIMLDAEAIVEYVLDKEDTEISKYVDKENVYIFGRSLGGAVAIYTVDKLKPNIRGLILENTFSSMGDMVDHLFPLFKYIKGLLLKNKWPSKDRIKNIALPMLFLLSENDELVPYKHMEDLYAISVNAPSKQKYVIIGGTHNESWQLAEKEYIKQIKGFVSKCHNSYFPVRIDDGTPVKEEEETYLINKKEL